MEYGQWVHRPRLVDAFPESFGRDISDYLKKSGGRRTVGYGQGPPVFLSPATIKNRRAEILRAAALLVGTGVDAQEIKKIEALFEGDHYAQILTAALKRIGQPTRGLTNFGRALLRVGRDYLGLDEAELLRLKGISEKVTIRKQVLSPSMLKNLEPLESAATMKSFLNLPFDGIERLRDERSPDYRTAVRARSYLAMAILIYAPMRSLDLANIDIGRNMKLPAKASGRGIRIILDRCDFRGHRHEYLLPVSITPLVSRYLRVYRPRLLQKTGKAEGSSKALFPGSRSKNVDPQSLANGVRKVIRDDLGLNFSPQMFRLLAAKLILGENPDNLEVLRSLFFYTKTKDIQMGYGQLMTRNASEIFDKVLRS